MTLKRIAIIGGTVWGNRGAAAMLETLIGRIGTAYPDAEFLVYSYYPEQDAQRVRDERITILSAKPAALALSLFPAALWAGAWRCLGLRWPGSLLPRGVCALRDADILLDIAGISFSDGRVIFLPFNILSLLPALLLGVPVGKCAQAMGPFQGVLNRACARFVLSRCRFIFGRGNETAAHLDQLNLTGPHVGQAPDLAFLHQADYAVSGEGREATGQLVRRIVRAREGGRQFICLNPSSLVHARCDKNGVDYPAMMARLCRKLIGQGHGVLLLPMATRAVTGGRLRNNDIPVIRRIVAEIRAGNGGTDSDALLWADWDMDYAAIKSMMGETDFVVASRFHGMVTALALGLPVLAIGWGHKYRELLAHFDLGEWSLDFSETDAGGLEQKTQALIDSADAIRKTIMGHLPGIHERAERQFTAISATLDGMKIQANGEA